MNADSTLSRPFRLCVLLLTVIGCFALAPAGPVHGAAIDISAQKRTMGDMRSIAIAVILGILVVVFYAATMVKFGPEALNRY